MVQSISVLVHLTLEDKENSNTTVHQKTRRAKVKIFNKHKLKIPPQGQNRNFYTTYIHGSKFPQFVICDLQLPSSVLAARKIFM